MPTLSTAEALQHIIASAPSDAFCIVTLTHSGGPGDHYDESANFRACILVGDENINASSHDPMDAARRVVDQYQTRNSAESVMARVRELRAEADAIESRLAPA